MRAAVVRLTEEGITDYYVRLTVGEEVFDVAGPFDDRDDAVAMGERALELAGCG